MSKSFYDFVVLNMKKSKLNQLFLFFLLGGILFGQKDRPRDLGLQIGLFNTGSWNAITDVKGVEVGHETLIYLSLIHI